MSGLKQIAYYGMSVLVLKGLGFLMMPVMTRLLTQSQYGYLNFLVTVCAACSLILSLGLPELLFRSKSASSIKQQSLLRDCLLISLLSSLALAVVALFLMDDIMLLLPAQVKAIDLYLLVINLMCSAMLAVPYSYWRIQGKAKQYCTVTTSHGLIQCALTLAFLYQGLSVTGVMLSGALASALVLVVALLKTRAALFVSFSSYPRQISRSDIYFLVSIIFSAVCLYACNGAENWFIVANTNTQTLAIYFVAAQFALMTSFAFEPVRMWWFAKRFQKLANNKALYAYETLRCLHIGILISMIMLIFCEQLIVLLLPSVYAQSAQWVTFLILVVVLRHHADLLNIGCYMKRCAQSVLIINAVSAIVMLGMMYWLVPIYSVKGAVFCLLLVQGIRAVAFYQTSQALEYVPYKLSNMLVAWLFIIVLVGLGFLNSEFIIVKRLGVLALYVGFLTRCYFKECINIVERARYALEHRYA
ncbi:hypothetical protein PSECIP111951_02578 [Pseudoalteromonas holothuriae]|uniref:Oligosaccharide translocase n=1 Tax=Pseudoalteromonas holothuriae TaxID=2963714 RepID=A0ABM9GJN0_9GAMM|nr:oligosaccharide flippase family protein [Pseudoalteromonas sp. CIP111951]CAH9061872.1 hypothetical protein PSECIP111951_02578 [Pseudoalteromonas sp. CIP111951]